MLEQRQHVGDHGVEVNDGRLADRGAFQYEFGKGQLAIDAARAFGLRAFEEADTTLLSGRRLSAREQGYVVAMMAYCTESASRMRWRARWAWVAC